MVGKYTLEIYNNKVHYYFEVKRNITIIQGDSATGKSTLINMISAYERLGSGSGITVKCEAKCAVLTSMGWQKILSDTSGYIFFIDENMPFIKTKEFAEVVNSSDNYFVIIYRDSLPQLSYSIEEIYGIREDRGSQKYINPKRVYNSLYNIYNLKHKSKIHANIVVTEDSNSGHEFFDNVFECECVSSGGKSNVYKVVEKHMDDNIDMLIVVDGAAFGSDIQRLLRTVGNKKCYIYAPESFEYLILTAGIVDFPSEFLERTYDYADSKKYSSWERFYTDKLVEITQDTQYRYTKSKLNPSYLNYKIIEKIKRVMPEILFSGEDVEC